MTMSNHSTEQSPHLHPLGFSRAKDLLPILPFGRASLWKFSKSGQFPAPVRITNGITAWRNADVISWLDNHAANNGGVSK